MKSNELRIGNYIKWLHEESESIVVVNSATINTIDYGNKHPEAEDFARGLWYTPIPLTSEILEKCGFELRDGYLKNYPLYSITSQNGKEQIQITDYMSLPQIKYLHQLQNLYFALTGKELIINL